MSQDTSYIAFISYRRLPLDTKAAKMIQSRIENYTIPKEFREQFGGKKFGHVFRDEDELPSTSSLSDSIYSALDRSKYLIVICTPNLPQSKWCEMEIEYFLKTHDRNHVLTVLVDGNPEQSFSPHLLHDFDEEGNPITDYTPLAANIDGPNLTINRKAFKKEITRLFAKFLDCPFDSLWQREKRARVNRLFGASIAVIVVLFAFLGVVLNRNARISEQSLKIEKQNIELQSRLSTALVDGGIVKLKEHDVVGAIDNALSSMENDDPAIYDHRVGKLLSDALYAYKRDEVRSSIVYSQPTGILEMKITDDKKHVLLLDEVGVLRCLDLATYRILWEFQTDAEDADNDYLDISAQIITTNLDNKVIYKDSKSCYALSIKDGTQIWSFSPTEGYLCALHAISDDASLFAVMMQNDNNKTSEIIFISTETGIERGRIDATEHGAYFPYLPKSDKPIKYAAAFSADINRFAYIIRVQETESNKQGYRLCCVDMDTFERRSTCFIEKDIYLFYGMDIDSADDSVFFAAYFDTLMYTCICKENGEIYELNDHKERNRFTMEGGIDSVNKYFGNNSCRYLCEKGRVFVISNNQLFIYKRAENKLSNCYSMSGTIVNAYWTDSKKNVMEFITDDGCVSDYTTVFHDGKTINNAVSCRLDQSNILKCCSPGTGSITDCGLLYTSSMDASGKLFFAELVSDPNMETLITGNKNGGNNGGISHLLVDQSDTGLLFYQDGTVASFDKMSGEILKATSFNHLCNESNAIILDENHFLIDNGLYGMDGSTEEYAKPVNQTYFRMIPSKSIRLFNGQILSWDMYPLFGYEGKESHADLGYLIGVALWLNGEPVEKTMNYEDAMIFYSMDYNTNTLAYGGENGLVLQYGYPVDIVQNKFSIWDKKVLCFTDAFSAEATIMETPHSSTEDVKPVFAHERKQCAVAYESRYIYIYDVESETVIPIENEYFAREIINLCFSDDDAYLLVLTSSGRLDIYETSSYRKVFSERINRFHEALEKMYSDSLNELSARVSKGSEIIFLTFNKECTVIDTMGWAEIAGLSKCISIYDKDTNKVFAIIDTCNANSQGIPEIVVYPCYDIPTLAEWARRWKTDNDFSADINSTY